MEAKVLKEIDEEIAKIAAARDRLRILTEEITSVFDGATEAVEDLRRALDRLSENV